MGCEATEPRGEAPSTKPSTKELRLVEVHKQIIARPPAAIVYQHTVLCQTCLPHRPTNARTWEQEQGNVSLRIEAGSIKRGSRWVQKELPHGEKPRLLLDRGRPEWKHPGRESPVQQTPDAVRPDHSQAETGLIHLNSEAVRTGSREVDVARSMTAFVQTIGIEPNGVHIREFKEQMARLAVATVRLAVGDERRTLQGQMQIVEALDVWWPKNKHGRIRWPDRLLLSEAYFRSIQCHPVPLDPRAVAVLKGSSLCLDIYCWLAQRLHRVHLGRPQAISWAALKEQFGPNYDRMVDFRLRFSATLLRVKTVYPMMRVTETEAGLTLEKSPPPVAKRLIKGGLGP